jgi:hypothetical protein
MLRVARSQKAVPPALRRCWKKTTPLPLRKLSRRLASRRSGSVRREALAGQWKAEGWSSDTPSGSSFSRRSKNLFTSCFDWGIYGKNGRWDGVST